VRARINEESHEMNRKTRQQLDLLKLLVKKEITLKYKRTYLGFFWSLLNPILTTLVLFIAFSTFMRFEMKDYTLFLLAAMAPWNWFSASVTMSTNTLTGNVSLIKKTLFPKHLLIVATIAAQFVTLIFSLPILLALVFYYGKTPSLNWLIGIPILIVVQFFTCYGIAMIVSMVNAVFRDMEHIVNICISMLFWMTPIIYPLQAVPEKYKVYMAINPVTYLIQSWREIFLNNNINWNYIAISAITAMVVVSIGTIIFRKLDRNLDEVL
jgi:lipopolysaccharide transport system permease protein